MKRGLEHTGTGCLPAAEARNVFRLNMYNTMIDSFADDQIFNNIVFYKFFLLHEL